MYWGFGIGEGREEDWQKMLALGESYPAKKKSKQDLPIPSLMNTKKNSSGKSKLQNN